MQFIDNDQRRALEVKKVANELKSQGREAVTTGYMDMVIGAGMWGAAAILFVVKPELWSTLGVAALAVTGYQFITHGDESVREGQDAINKASELVFEVDDLLSDVAEAKKEIELVLGAEKKAMKSMVNLVDKTKQEKNDTGFVSGRGMFSQSVQKQNVAEKEVVVSVAPSHGHS